MRRSYLFVAAIATALAFGHVATTPDVAEAGKARKGKKKRAKARKANDQAIAQLMGAFKFGMSKNDVLKVLRKQLRERYHEKITATQDVYVQDRLRKQRDRELRRIKKTFIEFKGKRTGWDVSILEDQFGHNNDESMMVYWENYEGKDQRRFFFFWNNRLYKMLIQLSTDTLSENQRSFEFFRKVMTRRFGPGQNTDWGLRWRGKKYELEALNKLAVHNAFVLVIADPQTRRKVVAMRAKNNPKVVERNNVIDAITDENPNEDDTDLLNEGSNTIDSIIDK